MKKQATPIHEMNFQQLAAMRDKLTRRYNRTASEAERDWCAGALLAVADRMARLINQEEV